MYRAFVRPQDVRGPAPRDAEVMTDTLLAQAAQKTTRLPLLDVLRGAAILGTLMTNVWIFTSPGSEWGCSKAL